MTEMQLHPRRTSELFDATVTVVRARFGSMVMASLIVAVPYALSSIPGLDLLVLLAALLTPIAFGATIFLAAGAYVGVTPDWQRALSYAWKEYLPLLIASVVAAIAIMAGLPFLIFPGIFLAISFALALESVMLEGRGGFSSLGRSWRLVNEHRGRIFWAGLIFFLVIGLAIGISYVIVLGLSNQTVADVWAGITNLVTIPLTSAFGVAFYFDLRVRKENLDADADQIDEIRMRLGAGPA
ncbi:MAG: hypothetical protein OXH10_05330 [bacterium]|nr:hypothetical protein [bacterium]MCY3579011.1 hypothetical protein [bacterium]MCY3652240.1 hypothetical protein [bacterium]MDE0643151.1 hypothetical protein [bacterium]